MTIATANEQEEAPLGEPTGVAGFGATILGLWRGGVEAWGIFVRTLYYVARGRTEKGDIAKQMFEIGNKSLFFLCVVMGFIGMILVLQAGIQAQRVVPDLTMLGATYIEVLVRELAPSLGAMMLATRVGAGIAAEIGSMVVTEQVDALRMCAADPVDYLVKPRFLASLFMTLILVTCGGATALLTGMLTAKAVFAIGPRTFFNTSMTGWVDLGVGIVKCIAYGGAIPIVSAYCGLSTFGGSEGVGWATTRAVVNSSLTVIVLNLVISTSALLMFGS